MDIAREPRRVALFVGVDEYADKSIPALSGAVADARSLHAFFSSRPKQFDVAELLENPTSDAVFDKVSSLSSDLGEGDLFMFFFAGHGMDDGGKQKLLCSNTRQGRRSLTNAFELDEVAGNEKWNVAVVLDACRTKLDGSRGVGERVCSGKRDLEFYDALVKSRAPGDASLTVLFSCDEGKTAGEVKGKNHGLFTLALLDVLGRADKDGTPWCFDQNLGDEIGRTMRRLADSDSGQRPWIKASGTPPLFFLPSMDLKPLVDWTRSLQDSGLLSLDEAAECQKALGATSPSPCAKGLFEAIRFFSQWGESRKSELAPEKTAAVVIKALCGGMNAASLPHAFPAVADSGGTEAKDETGVMPPRPLSGMEMRRLRETAAAAIGRWCAEETMRSALGRMASAQTNADAMSAIGSAEAVVRDAFVRENCIESGMGAGSARRLPPLFSPKTWGTLRNEVFGLLVPSDVDAALRSFFGVVGACCRLR